jgi:hypothetical protein
MNSGKSCIGVETVYWKHVCLALWIPLFCPLGDTRKTVSALLILNTERRHFMSDSENSIAIKCDVFPRTNIFCCDVFSFITYKLYFNEKYGCLLCQIYNIPLHLSLSWYQSSVLSWSSSFCHTVASEISTSWQTSLLVSLRNFEEYFSICEFTSTRDFCYYANTGCANEIYTNLPEHCSWTKRHRNEN